MVGFCYDGKLDEDALVNFWFMNFLMIPSTMPSCPTNYVEVGVLSAYEYGVGTSKFSALSCAKNCRKNQDVSFTSATGECPQDYFITSIDGAEYVNYRCSFNTLVNPTKVICNSTNFWTGKENYAHVRCTKI